MKVSQTSNYLFLTAWDPSMGQKANPWNLISIQQRGKRAKGQKGIPNALMGALKGDQAWGNRGGAPYSGRGGTSIGIDGEGIWLGH